VDRLGLIMLILIGTVPTAFALNHAVTTDQTQEFIAASKEAAAVFERHAAGLTASADPRTELTAYLRTHTAGPHTLLATGQLIRDLGEELSSYGLLAKLPAARTQNFRNDLYLVGEAIQLMRKSGQQEISPSEWNTLANYKRHVDLATRVVRYQKMNFIANCMTRGSPERVEIMPRALLEMFRSGSPNWGVLNMLNISQRNSKRRPSPK
jgi:inorganic phosphate transporter, PiT family